MADRARRPLDASKPLRPPPGRPGAEKRGGLTTAAAVAQRRAEDAADRRVAQLPVPKGSSKDGLVGNVLRTTPVVWRQLREIATEEDTYIQLLLLEALNLLFKDRGRYVFTMQEMRERPPEDQPSDA